MKNAFVVCSLVGLASALPSSHHSKRQDGPPTVKVKNGTIAGVHTDTYNQDYFLGVPFTQPPVGELRFRNPQSINKTYDGVLQATEYKPECYGYGSDQRGYEQTEDCLYLNVVRPSGCEDESLPVAVWIHGGGLSMGGASDKRYNLSFIVENSVQMGKPIIGVSIAYRLGPWGFLSSQEVTASGNTNIGLRDQRLALHWINENIDAFGGDPKKVTIWGESAGAGSVGWHLTAYNGRDDGIFRAGIMESGNPINYNSYKTNAFYQPKYNDLLKATNCMDALDSLDCLRRIPEQQLENLFNTTGLDSGFTNGWSPIVDGDFIQRWASIQLAQGDFVKVPIIDGTNTDEGTAFSPGDINSDEDFLNAVKNESLSNPLSEHFAKEVLDVYPNEPAYFVPPVEELPANYTYPPSQGSQYRRSAAYFGDVAFTANRRAACEVWAANNVPAYSYRFDTRPAGIPPSTGVTHFQEVAFVFDNTKGLGYGPQFGSGTVDPFKDEPQSFFDLAELMSKSWASFVYDLDPNNFKGRHESAEPWPKYSLDRPQNIVWSANDTRLAYSEPDDYRKQGMRWIIDHQLAYRR